MGRRTKWSEPGHERTIVETMKAARRLMALHKRNPLLVRAHKVIDRRLAHLERVLQRSRRKPLPQAKLDGIRREVANLIGDLVKSLIRYLHPRFLRPKRVLSLGAS